MWQFIGGLIAGVVSGLGLALLEPVQRRLATLSRKVLSDHGIESHIELDPNVIYAGWPDWVGFHYYLPEVWDRAAPPSNPRAWREWAKGEGGWDLQQSEERVTLTGTSPVSVVVETPIVDVSERPLPAGTAILHAVGGAEASPRGLMCNSTLRVPRTLGWSSRTIRGSHAPSLWLGRWHRARSKSLGSEYGQAVQRCTPGEPESQ